MLARGLLAAIGPALDGRADSRLATRLGIPASRMRLVWAVPDPRRDRVPPGDRRSRAMFGAMRFLHGG